MIYTMRNHPLELSDPEETKPSPEAHIKPWFETDRYFLGVEGEGGKVPKSPAADL